MEEREEILAKIREIIGNKKFTFSDAYINQCNGTPVIGDDSRRYNAITRKYLFIECWGVYSFSSEEGNNGWKFKRYPVCYRNDEGKAINKVPLDEVFTSDLKKIYGDILFFLWWESCVNMPKIKKALEDSQKFVNMYEKLKEKPDVI